MRCMTIDPARFMTTQLDAFCQTLSRLAPLSLAESWDNVGLLIGDRRQEVENVMTCLTISPPVVEESLEQNAQLIVTHHPLPFQPLKKITSDNVTGQMLLRLIASGVAVYSAHTAYDSAAEGINQRWAESLGLRDIGPLQPPQEPDSLGSGRFGTLEKPLTAAAVLRKAAAEVSANCPRLVGDREHVIRRIGFACGSGGSFLSAARRSGCDMLITGEANFHSCLEAESSGIALGLLGHYWSERFAMERLAEQLKSEHPELTIWASRKESDPIEPLELEND